MIDRPAPATPETTPAVPPLTGPAVFVAATAGLLLLIVGVAVGGLFAGGLALWLGSDAAPKPPSEPVDFASQGPTIEKIQALGEVVSTRVVVTDVLTGKGNGYRAMWRIRGDALLSCDLSRAEILAIDERAKTAVLRLPPIAVLSPRVNHAATKTWSYEKLSWLPFTTGDKVEMQEAAMYHAQKLIENAAGGEENRRLAADKAELVLRKSFGMVGCDVTVEWAEDGDWQPTSPTADAEA